MGFLEYYAIFYSQHPLMATLAHGRAPSVTFPGSKIMAVTLRPSGGTHVDNWKINKVMYYIKTSIHGKKKYATGHMDRLHGNAAGPQQMLPVQTPIEYCHSQRL